MLSSEDDANHVYVRWCLQAIAQEVAYRTAHALSSKPHKPANAAAAKPAGHSRQPIVKARGVRDQSRSVSPDAAGRGEAMVDVRGRGRASASAPVAVAAQEAGVSVDACCQRVTAT